MGRKSNYDKTPFTPVGPASSCEVGWTSILERLAGLRTRPRCVLVVECYPGVDVDGVRKALTEGLRPALVVDARQAFKDPAEVERLCAPYLGDDPVFGRLNGLTMADFLEPGRRAVLRGRVDAAREGLVLVFGPAAALVAGEPDVLVYANLARWEIQQRQRRHEIVEPRRPRRARAAGEALQARLLRRLARGRPPQAHAVRSDRLAARHHGARAEDDHRRGLPRAGSR